MTTLEIERKISAAFHGGEMTRRELRLTEAEAHCVAQTYPADVRHMGEDWYEISFREVFCHG